MTVIKELGNVKEGLMMIEEVLKDHIDELPKGKTLRDFGGGYVELLKTKANVVLYFGFDRSNNRVSAKFEIEQEEIHLWLEAMSEKLWFSGRNKKKVSFGSIKKKIEDGEEWE